MTDTDLAIDGPARTRVAAIVDHIHAALRASIPDDAALGLSGGLAGIGLFQLELAVLRDDAEILEQACTTINTAIDRSYGQPPDFALFSGLPGVGFAAQRLIDLCDPTGDDPLVELDARILAHLESADPTHYDLVSGLVGVGVYMLTRAPRPAAVHGVHRIVELLRTTAVAHPAGLAWFTPASRVPTAQRRLAPDGYTNLGLAHGVPGVVAFLAQCVLHDVARKPSLALLRPATAFLWSCRTTPAPSQFPYWLADGHAPLSARLAWCYGDPGVAAALQQAARALDDATLLADTVALARDAAAFPIADAGTRDASLCHGAAGLLHMHHRMLRTTGDPAFKPAVELWLARTCELHDPTLPGPGIQRWLPDRGWLPEDGLLEGAAGVGLALCALLSPDPPTWDACLLLDPGP